MMRRALARVGGAAAAGGVLAVTALRFAEERVRAAATERLVEEITCEACEEGATAARAVHTAPACVIRHLASSV